MSRARRALLLILLNVIGIGLVVALFEGVGRLFLMLRPSYEVVFLQADRQLGWKQVPSHRYTWAGSHWYAVDFSTPIEINSLGFRDRERSVAKPAGVVRVAMLGDSFVEAMQVPFERTAAQLLERRLEEAPPKPDPARYEVLNFGISNFSVGQYLLVFEEHARRFAPDYTVVFVGVEQMDRTVWKYELGGFPETRDTWLNVVRGRGTAVVTMVVPSSRIWMLLGESMT